VEGALAATGAYCVQLRTHDGHTFTRRDPYALAADYDSDWCFLDDSTAFPWSDRLAQSASLGSESTSVSVSESGSGSESEEITIAPASGWAPRPFDEYIIYEMHVGSFTPEVRDGRNRRRRPHSAPDSASRSVCGEAVAGAPPAGGGRQGGRGATDTCCEPNPLQLPLDLLTPTARNATPTPSVALRPGRQSLPPAAGIKDSRHHHHRVLHMPPGAGPFESYPDPPPPACSAYIPDFFSILHQSACHQIALLNPDPDPDPPPRGSQGTLAAAAARLEHVAALGFTAVQLMPITEHSDAWGYNPRLLMALHGGATGEGGGGDVSA
jgi:hypothetical protein